VTPRERTWVAPISPRSSREALTVRAEGGAATAHLTMLRLGFSCRRHRGIAARGSRLSAGGMKPRVTRVTSSRLSALGSRLSALGSRLWAFGSRLSALGSGLSARGITKPHGTRVASSRLCVFRGCFARVSRGACPQRRDSSPRARRTHARTRRRSARQGRVVTRTTLLHPVRRREAGGRSPPSIASGCAHGRSKSAARDSRYERRARAPCAVRR
jgi:hypothetical protein